MLIDQFKSYVLCHKSIDNIYVATNQPRVLEIQTNLIQQKLFSAMKPK